MTARERREEEGEGEPRCPPRADSLEAAGMRRGKEEGGKREGLTDGVRMSVCRFSELANVGIMAIGICKPALSVLKGERTSFRARQGGRGGKRKELT